MACRLLGLLVPPEFSMILALLATAQAFTLEETARWGAPPDPRALVYLERAEGARLVVLGAAALRLIDPGTGVAIDEADLGGDALLARDADGDGESELWVCGPTGLWRVGWGPDRLDAPIRVATDGCGAIVDVGDGIVTAGRGVQRWKDDGAGSVTGPLGLAFAALEGPPLLAWDGANLAASTVGSGTVQVLGAFGLSTLAAGGDVGGLGLFQGDLAWTLDSGLLASADGGAVALEEGPGTFLAADVDGEGVDDLVVLHADTGAIGILHTGAAMEQMVSVSVGAVGLAAADKDGDGCLELAWLDVTTDEVRLVSVANCEDLRDADGDGWTPEQGDCDDTNGEIHPAATEACNGYDDDCDGVLDPLPTYVTLVGPTELNEGDSFELVTSDDGCRVSVEWGVPRRATFHCTESRAGLTCEAFDDDRVVLSAAIFDTEGVALVRATHTVEIVNVPPRLATRSGCGGSVFTDDEVVVHPGDRFDEQLEAVEPGDDTVVFKGRNLPPGMSLSESGFMRYHVADTLGTFRPTLVLTDDDGGRTEQTITIRVKTAPRCGCCCGSSSAAFLMGLSALFGRRRGPSSATHPNRPNH